jgi:hypothetical protein
MTERAYCRVYYSIKDDPKFEAIYDDDHHLATWLRLLIAADAIWPASPDIPIGARKASLAALVDVGLVDLGTSRRYRIHGLDAERGARSAAARSSVAQRTYPVRNTNVQRPSYSRSEPSQAKPSLDRAEPTPARRNGMEPIGAILPRAEPDTDAFGVSEQEGRVFTFIARHGASIRPDQGLGIRLLGLMERRGVEEVLRHAGIMAKAGAKLSDRQWVFGLEAALEIVPSPKDAREADAAEDARKRSERIQAEMLARRKEHERWVKTS